MKKREANLELLRIVAMLMIICLHYLGKGNTLLMPGEEGFTIYTAFAWLLEAICIGATNLYVLISGYFLVTSEFKIEKCIKIWMQVLFYSLGIFVLMLGLGKISLSDCKDVYFLTKFIFPLNAQHYWFPSIYILFYLLSPFLAVCVRALSKKQMQGLIAVLLLLFSTIGMTLIPTTVGFGDGGMGIIWFVCLFVIAAYIRLYVPITGKKCRGILVYILASVAVFGTLYIIYGIFVLTGKQPLPTNLFYYYNSPLVTLASVAAFLVFLNLKIKDGFFSKAILKVSGLTFGIYLIHEHELLRDLWTTFWKVDQYSQTPLFPLHCIAVVTAVFILCAVIEYIRQLLFMLLYKTKLWKAVIAKLSVVNAYFNVQTGEQKK